MTFILLYSIKIIIKFIFIILPNIKWSYFTFIFHKILLFIDIIADIFFKIEREVIKIKLIFIFIRYISIKTIPLNKIQFLFTLTIIIFIYLINRTRFIYFFILSFIFLFTLSPISIISLILPILKILAYHIIHFLLQLIQFTN